MRLKNIKQAIRKYENRKQAKNLQRFFKTGKGEYAEGDIFLGIRVPVLRKLSRKFQAADLAVIVELLKSLFHEERLLALLILVLKYRDADEPEKEKIYSLYLTHTNYINNWDLVDVTAKHIIGAFLFDKDRTPLYKLVKSKNLWERRIAVLSTFYFIGCNDFIDSLKIAELLIPDNHDLIHKAVGWMLREVGKRNIIEEEKFLDKYRAKMPRVMLRYAIERFPESKRQEYLRG